MFTFLHPYSKLYSAAVVPFWKSQGSSRIIVLYRTAAFSYNFPKYTEILNAVGIYRTFLFPLGIDEKIYMHKFAAYE